jgi:hypothetical protein
MPRYFFHLRDHGTVHEDPEGTELSDDEAARAEALMTARDLLRIGQLSVRDWLARSYEIVDESGRLVAVVSFPEAIDVVV